MTTSDAKTEMVSDDRFSLVRGGPFQMLLGRLHLLDTEHLPSLRAAFLLALLAWLPPAVFALASYLLHDNADAITYFLDYTNYIRTLVAIPVLVMTERQAHQRLTPVIDHFNRAGLLVDSDLNRFRAIVRQADDRSASNLVEAGLLVVVIGIAVFGITLDVGLGGFNWDGRVVDGGVELTLAGAWSHWIVKPLFQFLVLRWIWRFVVWGWLLFRISSLPLKLVAYHPDRSGGLGFLSVYPMVFSGLIFAMSAVVAAQLVSEVMSDGMAGQMVWSLIASWCIFVLLVFVGPLAVFLKPLYLLRERAIFELGAFASNHQMAFQKKWLERESNVSEVLGSEDVSSVADIAPLAASPYEMRTLPITLPMVLDLLLTSGAPMLAVVATQIPLTELLSIITVVL